MNECLQLTLSKCCEAIHCELETGNIFQFSKKVFVALKLQYNVVCLMVN